MINFKKISTEQEIENPVLRERYRRGSSPKTLDFIVLSGASEAGILIYEDWGTPEGFIYEILVLRDFRKRGIANLTLSQAELIATELGHTAIRLDARTLDPEELSHDDLAAWYGRRGYVWLNSEAGRLEKVL